MKKYHQLLLLIVSLVSLTLLLVYRHEYNRLHYVLEVFNFFGQPCNFSDLQQSTNTLSHHDWGPMPLWQQSENVYMYSAFWNDKSEAKAIIVHSDSHDIARSCYLWFEDSEKPFLGKFKYSKIERDESNSLTVYFYYCSLPDNKHVPYAVSFTVKTKKSIELKKMLLTNTLSHKAAFNSTVCVPPSVFAKREFIEFLSFHRLIGIESFIFYSDSIPHRLTKIISNLSNKLGVDVVFFPFNFPKTESNLIRKLVELDCILRTPHESNNVITLQTNEYLVPSKYTFNELVSDVEDSLQRISLPVQKFCIKNTNRGQPVAVQNTDIYYTDDNIVYDIVRHSPENNLVNTKQVNRQIASVHKYVYCSDDSKRMYIDNSVLKYSTDFVRSTLVQLLLHNHI